MAKPSLAQTLAQFTGTVHKTKNRLVAVPAAVQRQLGLQRRPDNHLICCSIRPAGTGRWNNHYFKLTSDNEFALPTDLAQFGPGDAIDVKIHQLIADRSVSASGAGGAPPRSPAFAALLEIASEAGDDPRTDGSERIDEYLAGEIGMDDDEGGGRDA